MRSLLLGIALSVLLASPASAWFKCRSWESLDDDGK
jgi:hypothetical protein